MHFIDPDYTVAVQLNKLHRFDERDSSEGRLRWEERNDAHSIGVYIRLTEISPAPFVRLRYSNGKEPDPPPPHTRKK